MLRLVWREGNRAGVLFADCVFSLIEVGLCLPQWLQECEAVSLFSQEGTAAAEFQAQTSTIPLSLIPLSYRGRSLLREIRAHTRQQVGAGRAKGPLALGKRLQLAGLMNMACRTQESNGHL